MKVQWQVKRFVAFLSGPNMQDQTLVIVTASSTIIFLYLYLYLYLYVHYVLPRVMMI